MKEFLIMAVKDLKGLTVLVAAMLAVLFLIFWPLVVARKLDNQWWLISYLVEMVVVWALSILARMKR